MERLPLPLWITIEARRIATFTPRASRKGTPNIS